MTRNRGKPVEGGSDDSFLIQARNEEDEEKIGRDSVRFLLVGASFEVHAENVRKTNDDGSSCGECENRRHRPRTFCQPIRMTMVSAYSRNTAPDNARRAAATLP